MEEVNEVYIHNYKNLNYNQVMFLSKIIYGSAYYQESHIKSNYCADDFQLNKNDYLVIRGYQLGIKEYDIGFSCINIMRVVKVNKDSFVIRVAKGNVELNNKYKKYFYLVDALKFVDISQSKLDFLQRYKEIKQN